MRRTLPILIPVLLALAVSVGENASGEARATIELRSGQSIKVSRLPWVCNGVGVPACRPSDPWGYPSVFISDRYLAIVISNPPRVSQTSASHWRFRYAFTFERSQAKSFGAAPGLTLHRGDRLSFRGARSWKCQSTSASPFSCAHGSTLRLVVKGRVLHVYARKLPIFESLPPNPWDRSYTWPLP
jgi:hypothetical protein